MLNKLKKLFANILYEKIKVIVIGEKDDDKILRGALFDLPLESSYNIALIKDERLNNMIAYKMEINTNTFDEFVGNLYSDGYILSDIVNDDSLIVCTIEELK